jgi:hypothetical protein
LLMNENGHFTYSQGKKSNCFKDADRGAICCSV